MKSVLIPFARHIANNRMVSIDEVAQGVGCGCVCPACNAPLVAKKGELLQHHFAHQGDHPCPYGDTAPETALHQMAKQLIAEHQTVITPAWRSLIGPGHPGGEAARIKLARVDLEARQPGFTPDALSVVAHTGEHLAVEIRVTHAVDAGKAQLMRQQRLATVEIDLSNLSRDNLTKDRVVQALNDRHRITWVYCPAQAVQFEAWTAEQNRLETERAQREDERAEQRRMRNEDPEGYLGFHYPDLILYLRNMLADPGAQVDRWEAEMSDHPLYQELSEYFGRPVGNLPVMLRYPLWSHTENKSGALAFDCDDRIWQAMLLREFLIKRPSQGSPVFTNADASNWLYRQLRDPWCQDLQELMDDVKQDGQLGATLDEQIGTHHCAFQARGPDGAKLRRVFLPRAAVAQYLQKLSKNGYLERLDSSGNEYGRWELVKAQWHIPHPLTVPQIARMPEGPGRSENPRGGDRPKNRLPTKCFFEMR